MTPQSDTPDPGTTRSMPRAFRFSVASITHSSGPRNSSSSAFARAALPGTRSPVGDPAQPSFSISGLGEQHSADGHVEMTRPIGDARLRRGSDPSERSLQFLLEETWSSPSVLPPPRLALFGLGQSSWGEAELHRWASSSAKAVSGSIVCPAFICSMLSRSEWCSRSRSSWWR